MVVAVLALVGAIVAIKAGREGWSFALSGITIAAAVAMLFLALFPNVMPSSLNDAWNLTVSNASSSPYTLKIMTWCAGVATPIVLLYQGWTYWVFRKRIGTQEHRRRALTSEVPPVRRGVFHVKHALRPDSEPSSWGMFHVKPIDPRLLRYARATRFFLAAVVALGLAGAGLIIAQAMLIAEVVVGAFQHGHDVGRAADAAAVPRGGRGRAGSGLLAHGARRPPGERGGQVGAAGPAPGPGGGRSAPSGWADSARDRWSRSPRAASTRSTTTSRAICRSWASRWWCRWRCSPGSSPRTGCRRRPSSSPCRSSRCSWCSSAGPPSRRWTVSGGCCPGFRGTSSTWSPGCRR